MRPLALLLLTVLAPSLLPAADPCRQGPALEKARRWPQALEAYRACLKAHPGDWAALRGQGVCLYSLGDTPAALASLDGYLARRPQDKAMADFVARLRPAPTPRAISPTAAVATPRPTRTATPKPALQLSLLLGSQSLAMADWNRAAPALEAGELHQAALVGLAAALRPKPHVRIDFGLEYLPVSVAAGPGTYNLNLLSVGLEGSGTYAPAGLPLELRAGAGLSWDSLCMAGFKASRQGYPSDDFSATGLGVKVLAGAEWWFMRRLPVGLDLGWRFSKFGEVQYQNGTRGGTMRNPSDNSALALDYSGPFARLRVGWLFY